MAAVGFPEVRNILNDLGSFGLPGINIGHDLVGIASPPTTGLGGVGFPVPGGNALPGPKVKAIDEGLNQGMEYDKPGEVSKEKGDKEKKKEGSQKKPPRKDMKWDKQRKKWVDDDYVYHWDEQPHKKRGGVSHWDRGRIDGQGRGEWSPDGINWYPK
jgi:hypothetical protein